MQKSISEWLVEGEQLYTEALAEYQELEVQRSELRKRMDEKLGELNRLATVINKPKIEPRAKALTGTVVDSPKIGNSSSGHPVAIPNTASTIARALQGRL